MGGRSQRRDGVACSPRACRCPLSGWGGDASFCCWGTCGEEVGTRRLLRSSAPLALSLPLRLVAHGIWAKSGRLLSEAHIVAASLAAAWGLAPCGATRGFPIGPTAELCLGSRNGLLGTGVPLLGSESRAWVCFSSPCLPDTRVLGGACRVGRCAPGPRGGVSAGDWICLNSSRAKSSSCHLRLDPGHRAVFPESRGPASSAGGLASRGPVGE